MRYGYLLRRLPTCSRISVNTEVILGEGMSETFVFADFPCAMIKHPGSSSDTRRGWFYAAF
jgi:hypothetical protein